MTQYVCTYCNLQRNFYVLKVQLDFHVPQF